MVKLDWIAMGNRGVNKLLGMRLLLRYFAELSSIFLKVLKIAIFCEVLKCSGQIIAIINIKDK
jgi:hypothetical protein|tara:strand:+ start:622 stop:810 length:189 start_codon:yes stop_codon:yes gene_type:complete